MSNKRDVTLGSKFKKQVVEVEVRNRRPRYPSNAPKDPSKEELESKKVALDNFELSSVSMNLPVEKKVDQNTRNRALFFGDKKLARSMGALPRKPFNRPPQEGHQQRTHHHQGGHHHGGHHQGGHGHPQNQGTGYRRPFRPDEVPRTGFPRPAGYVPRSFAPGTRPAGYVPRTFTPGARPAGYVPRTFVPGTRPPTGAAPFKKPPFGKNPPLFKSPTRPFDSKPSGFSKSPGFSKPFHGLDAKRSFPFTGGEQNKKQTYKKTDYRSEKSIRSRSSFGPTNNVQLGHRFIGRIDSEEDVSINLERQRSISAIKRAREKQKKVSKVVRDVTIFENVSVSSLSNLMAVSAGEVIQKLKELEISADKQTKLNIDTANLIVQEFGHNVKMRAEPLNTIKIDEGLDEDKEPRPPIVTVVGHVDHGKTSLLDALRMTQFTSKESGGITQSIGASQVFTKSGRSITFIDTPGHQIFTEMRARGVNITDIVLVLIAADDGIKEQTIESIQHAKASKAFIIVVITKVDKPGSNPEKIKQMLFQYDLAVESMGGDIPDIEVSAKSGHNLNELIELILICSDNLNLVASSKPKAAGIILESNLDKAIGPVATVIIKSGTIKVQDSFLSGSTYGKVKAMRDWTGKLLKVAGPSYPVQVMGFDQTPLPGQDFIVMTDAEARDLASKRQEALQVAPKIGQEKNMMYTAQEIWDALVGNKKAHMMNFIIKADTHGSVEAIASSILKLKLEDTECAIILKGVGAVSESDVMLAKTSQACVIAFKVDVSTQVSKAAQSFEVQVKKYSIIYKIVEDIEDEVTDRLRPKEEEVSIGRAVIRQIFSKPKLPTIAGCYVTDGLIKRDAKCVVLRNGIHVYESKIMSIKQMRDDKREVKFNQECGIIVENFVDYKVGDVIECFENKPIV